MRPAHDLIGVDRLYVGGTEYRDDSTGAVLAVYAAADINLGAHFHQYRSNGVARLHRMMRDHRLYLAADAYARPEPGDIVFFDNTWDRNGTISYLHNHLRRGVIVEQMNLRHPDSRELNAPLRQRGSPRDGSGRWLASHLVRGFGRAHLLPT